MSSCQFTLKGVLLWPTALQEVVLQPVQLLLICVCEELGKRWLGGAANWALVVVHSSVIPAFGVKLDDPCYQDYSCFLLCKYLYEAGWLLRGRRFWGSLLAWRTRGALKHAERKQGSGPAQGLVRSWRWNKLWCSSAAVLRSALRLPDCGCFVSLVLPKGGLCHLRVKNWAWLVWIKSRGWHQDLRVAKPCLHFCELQTCLELCNGKSEVCSALALLLRKCPHAGFSEHKSKFNSGFKVGCCLWKAGRFWRFLVG